MDTSEHLQLLPSSDCSGLTVRVFGCRMMTLYEILLKQTKNFELETVHVCISALQMIQG